MTNILIHQSSPRHEVEDNGRFANFQLLLAIRNAWNVAQILGGLSYKVCSNSLPKFVTTEPSLLILGQSTIFSLCLVVMLSRHQILVYIKGSSGQRNFRFKTLCLMVTAEFVSLPGTLYEWMHLHLKTSLASYHRVVFWKL